MKHKKTVSTKSQPAKRKYTKRENPTGPWYNELDQLALLCQVIDSWSDEQKERNLTFINSKYSKHLPK